MPPRRGGSLSRDRWWGLPVEPLRLVVVAAGVGDDSEVVQRCHTRGGPHLAADGQ